MSATKSAIEEQIKRMISDKGFTSDKELSLDTSLSNDIGMDSLDKLELLMELETHYGFSLSEGDEDGIDTIGDIVEYISDRKGC